MTGLSVWNLMEVQIGIIAACGPTLRQVLARAIRPTTSSIKSLLSRLGAGTGSSSGQSNHGTDSENRQYYNKDELPSFVKIPEGTSLERLHSPGVMHVAKVHSGKGGGNVVLTDITLSTNLSSSTTSAGSDTLHSINAENYEMRDVGVQTGAVTVTRKYDVKSGDSLV